MLGAFRMRPSEHVIQVTPFSSYLRGHLRDPDIFTAFNVKTKRWFLAYWINKDQGLAEDIEELGTVPVGTRALVKFLEETRKGEPTDTLRKSILRNHKARMVAEREESEEFQDVQNWVQKRSGSPIPVIMN